MCFFHTCFVLIYFFSYSFLSVFIYYLYILYLPKFFVLSKPPFLPRFALPTRKDYESREKEFCHVGEGNGAGLREEKWVPLPGEWILNVVFLRACVGLISAWLDVQFWLITSSGLLFFFFIVNGFILFVLNELLLSLLLSLNYLPSFLGIFFYCWYW